MKTKAVGCLLVLVLLGTGWGQAQGLDTEFEFYPNAQYDPAIPTLAQVVGHDWAERISSHAEIQAYVKVLGQASPKISLTQYGKSWEGRALYLMIVASEANQARLASIREANRALAEPDQMQADFSQLTRDLPATVWLAYGVHGNEISSSDAALLTAYHLAAAQEDPVVDQILSNAVVIINPTQNPDGRDRFVYGYRQKKARWPDPDPQAAEHSEGWPSGRTNHYLFDMNRDWFAHTQRETQGHAAAYLQWFPQVFVDLHEMGSNSTYYFAPPADPLNPQITPEQWSWLQRLGQNNAGWFDRFGFDYFTREVFDSFYPGYGESWPLFQGSIGMTYEQASSEGLVIERNDDTLLRYRDAVQHHFIASLSTAEAAARQRQELLQYFYDYRRTAIEEGKTGSTREYLLPPGPDPVRTADFVALLMRQGIRVRQATREFKSAPAVNYMKRGPAESVQLPSGTYSIPLAQPAKRLIQTLLDRHTAMDEAFVQEQVRRRQKGLGDQIYDVTGWSFPLLYGLDVYSSGDNPDGAFTWLDAAPSVPGQVINGPAQLAYLVPWGSNAAAGLLADLLSHKIRVHASDREFTLNGRSYPRGSLVIKVAQNPEDLYELMSRLAAAHSVQVFTTDSSWVDKGINLGSNQVRYVKPVRIGLAYGSPTSPGSAGATRYLLEQQYAYPVTILECESLARLDLNRYDVLILPDARRDYGSALNESAVNRLKDWISQGGTLVALGRATRWLTEEGVGLLATERELQKTKTSEEKEESESPDEAISLEPDKQYPPSTPGALFRVELDTEHWLAFGYRGQAVVMVNSSNIFTPLKRDKGFNVGRYAASNALLSGFTWEAAEKQLPGKAYLMHQPRGRGHVIAFAEDPNYRAFMNGLNLLFINAVFLGPAH